MHSVTLPQVSRTFQSTKESEQLSSNVNGRREKVFTLAKGPDADLGQASGSVRVIRIWKEQVLGFWVVVVITTGYCRCSQVEIDI